MSVLAILEQRSGQWNRMSFETLAAAQQLLKELGATASAAVLGQGTGFLGARRQVRARNEDYRVR